jgi:hypothetical protein
MVLAFFLREVYVFDFKLCTFGFENLDVFGRPILFGDAKTVLFVVKNAAIIFDELVQRNRDEQRVVLRFKIAFVEYMIDENKMTCPLWGRMDVVVFDG